MSKLAKNYSIYNNCTVSELQCFANGAVKLLPILRVVKLHMHTLTIEKSFKMLDFLRILLGMH